MATITIGFTKPRTFDIGGGQVVECSFWALDESRLKHSAKDGEVTLVPYTDRAAYEANKGSYYWPGKIRFRLNPTNWPFTDENNYIQDFYSWLKLQSEIENDDGDMINGGIDWTTATEETKEV